MTVCKWRGGRSPLEFEQTSKLADEWCKFASLIFITLWYTQQSADEPPFPLITPTVTGCVWVRVEEGRCNGAHQKRNMNGSYLLQLRPRVAPGPVVRFVLTEPHSHQFIPTVIEDWPVKGMQTENIRRSFLKPTVITYALIDSYNN